MHCSGTSATARIVNLLGVDFGPPEVAAPARRSNTRGLWEHPRMTRMGEQILRELGGAWNDPPPLDPGWQRAPSLEVHRRRARQLVDELYGGPGEWGWKDPRSCLLAPFWEEILGPLRYVVCIRDPRDVAASLERRDGMPPDQGKALWLRYTRSALETTADRPRLVAAFEHLWAGRASVDRLAAFLGREDVAASSEFRAEVDDWLAPELWHHRAGATARPAGEDPAERLYAELLEAETAE